MAVTTEQYTKLQNFISRSEFRASGGIITDLDGTAVHEFEGKITIPKQVEFGLKKIHDLGRPVVLNTLRFPLSVIRTFGKEWYEISNSPIPTVLMNGSQLGYIKNINDELIYEEIDAFPLSVEDINEILIGVEGLIKDNIKDLMVFYYPRDWKQGEIIWTPAPEKIQLLKHKYLSASYIYSSDVESLKNDLESQEICMIFLLIEVERDKLMAYQHSKPSSFFTRKGVDKLYGMEQIALRLGFDVLHSIGAGDTPMDTFLNGVGLAVLVGNHNLEFKGIKETINLANSGELGDLLFDIVGLELNLIK